MLDKTQAETFLRALDPSATTFTFQTFDDDKHRKDRRLAHVLHGPLDQHWATLEALNKQGAGVFVTVQETDGKGRKAENITRIRAVFHEDDTGEPVSLPPTAQIEVESSPGKRHRYWLVDGLDAAGFAGVMACMVEKHGSDKNAKDIARVLRLPGTYNVKPGREPQLCKLIKHKLARVGPLPAEDITRAFPAPPPPEKLQSKSANFDRLAVLRALSYVPAIERETWLSVGMSLHHATGGDAEGFALWDIWSQTAPEKYNPTDNAASWARFSADRSGGAVTLGTLYHLAGKHGFELPRGNPLDGFSVIETAPRPSLLRFPHEVTLEAILRASENDIVRGVLPLGEEAVIYGDPGAGKTFLAIDLVWHVAKGLTWKGRKVKRHPVLYIQLEGQNGFDKRMIAATLTYGDTGGWLARITVPVALNRELGDKGIAIITEAARELAAKCGMPVGVIVIDTLSRALAGDDENAQDAMSKFLDRMATLRNELKCTVIAVHHTNKQGGMRGSSVLLGGVNTVLRCDRDRGTGARSVYAEKVKDGEEESLFSYKLDTVHLGVDSDLAPVTSCVVVEVAAVDVTQAWGRAVLPLVSREPVTVSAIAEILAASDLYRGESKSTLVRKIVTAFAGGSVSIDGATLVYAASGKAGGTIARVTNNH